MTPFKTPDHSTMREASIYWIGVADALNAVEAGEDLNSLWACLRPDQRKAGWHHLPDPEDWINHGGSI